MSGGFWGPWKWSLCWAAPGCQVNFSPIHGQNYFRFPNISTAACAYFDMYKTFIGEFSQSWRGIISALEWHKLWPGGGGYPMWSDCNGGEPTDWTIIIFSRQELEQQRRSLRPIKCPTSHHCVPDVDTLAGPALWVTSKSPEVLLHPFTPSTHLMRTIYRESAAVALVTEATFANWHTKQSGPIIERQKNWKT